MDWIQLAKELDKPLRRGDLGHCISRVSEVMRELPETPFHHVLLVDFTNDPAEVARHFDLFASNINPPIRLAAIYTETNGFFINPDRWYFDIFGYSTFGGYDDYDWLAYWDARYPHEIPLTGMETLQDIYSHILESGVYQGPSSFDDPMVRQLHTANEICDLMVVLLFQRLIRNCVQYLQQVRVPVLATSHEYDDFIFEIRPPFHWP